MTHNPDCEKSQCCEGCNHQCTCNLTIDEEIHESAKRITKGIEKELVRLINHYEQKTDKQTNERLG